MNRMRALGTFFVVAVAGLAIWVASTGMRQGSGDSPKTETPANAYDYQATDVVITQMGPDGTLQYELTAKQISQEPNKGRISAQDLVMHRDPPGSPPGGPNRWTLSADRADLPELNGSITLQGNVRAEGRPQNSRVTVAVAAEELTYNLQTQDVFTKKPVDFSRGSSRYHCGDVRMNIKDGTVAVESECNGTFAP